MFFKINVKVIFYIFLIKDKEKEKEKYNCILNFKFWDIFINVKKLVV